MNKDKEYIDDFFKDYLQSLPDNNLSEQREIELKKSIYEKINKSKPQKKNVLFKDLLNNFFSTKQIFTKVAFVSLFLVISAYFIFNHKKEKPISQQTIIANKDTVKANIDEEINETKELVKEKEILDVQQLATLNYDFSTRSIENNINKIEEEVIGIVKKVLAKSNIIFSVNNYLIETKEFEYKNKISFLRIIIDTKNKDLKFELHSKISNNESDNLLKINPAVIINEIERELLTLALF